MSELSANERLRERVLRTIAGQEVYCDWEGFLWDPDDWNEELAVAFAAESGIAELSEEQWQVIHFVRDYYEKNLRAPLNKELRKGTGLSLLTLDAMFPEGLRLGARKVAGLPNPKVCT